MKGEAEACMRGHNMVLEMQSHIVDKSPDLQVPRGDCDDDAGRSLMEVWCALQ